MVDDEKCPHTPKMKKLDREEHIFLSKSLKKNSKKMTGPNKSTGSSDRNLRYHKKTIFKLKKK